MEKKQIRRFVGNFQRKSRLGLSKSDFEDDDGSCSPYTNLQLFKTGAAEVVNYLGRPSVLCTALARSSTVPPQFLTDLRRKRPPSPSFIGAISLTSLFVRINCRLANKARFTRAFLRPILMLGNPILQRRRRDSASTQKYWAQCPAGKGKYRNKCG